MPWKLISRALLDKAVYSDSAPPAPNGFIAYVHASFMQQVFYISKRERKSHIQHNCKLDDLRTGFEIAEGNMFRHSWIANYQASPQQGSLF